MSLSATEEFHPKSYDAPKQFDVEQHQIDMFRRTKKGNELWEFLERFEEEGD